MRAATRFSAGRYNAHRYGYSVTEAVAVERPPQGELALAIVSRPEFDHILAFRPTREGRLIRELRLTRRSLTRRLRE